MAIVIFGFDVVGIPEVVQEELPPGSAPVVNLFKIIAPSGGFNIDGVTQSLGDSTGPPIPDHEVLLTLSPAQLEPGQGANLRVEVRLNDEPAPGQFTVTLSSSDQQVAPVPTTVITDQQGVVLMEVIALNVGATTISATTTINNLVYGSNQVTLIVAVIDTAENYDATGYGVIRASLESSLSRGIFPNPQRLSHEEQDRKHPGDTGLSRIAFFANAELVFMPGFLQQR